MKPFFTIKMQGFILGKFQLLFSQKIIPHLIATYYSNTVL